MLDSIIRTLVPLIIGALITGAARLGFDLHPDMTVTEIVTVLVTGAYYWLARFVEQHWPGVGRLLLSLGLARRTPVYIANGGKVTAGRVEPPAGEHWPQPGQM